MQTLQRAQNALQESQRMEAVGKLTGGIAHDFNNMLFAISGSLNLIAEGGAQTNRFQSLIATALRASERGAQLVNQLLAFARRQPLKPELVNLDEQLRDFRLLVTRSAGEAIEVKFGLESANALVLIDPPQLQSTILNLVANARDAMSGRGRLWIKTENVQVQGMMATMRELVPGPYVVLAVRDTGVGMPPETLVRAFEPFFTTKPVGKGTGLGLSQVYGFARQSGGIAEIESTPDDGTTVRIYLPQAERRNIYTQAPSPPIESHGRGERILVVEDDPNVLDTAVAMLSFLGYCTVVAETGRAAIAMLEQGEQVDLLFTDIVMPGGIDGLELARAANSRYPELKVLLTTGYSSASLANISSAPDLPIIRKPYSPAALAVKLREILG